MIVSAVKGRIRIVVEKLKNAKINGIKHIRITEVKY